MEAGADVRTALVQSGRTHVRPILKTAVATILALIPLALSSDEGLVAASLATVAIIRAPACPARQRELDSAAAVIYLGRYYTGLALEDFLAALATPVHGSVLSNLKRHRPPTHHRLSLSPRFSGLTRPLTHSSRSAYNCVSTLQPITSEIPTLMSIC